VAKIHYKVIHGLGIFLCRTIRNASMREHPTSLTTNTLKHLPKKWMTRLLLTE